MVPEKKGTLIADVGCGSGCLGLTLALKSPSSTVYLSDISKKALAVAKQNNSSQNTRFLVSNLFDSFPKVLFWELARYGLQKTYARKTLPNFVYTPLVFGSFYSYFFLLYYNG